MGEEIGMTNTPVPLARAQDVLAKGFRFLPESAFQGLQRLLKETINRDEVRTAMQWDTSAHAGFCADDVEPWLPVNSNRNERSVAAQVGEADSLFELHRKLLRLRRGRPALHRGDMTILDGTPPEVLAYRRRAGDDLVTTYTNFSGRAFNLPTDGAQGILLTTDGTNRVQGNTVDLVAHSAMLISPVL